MSCVAGRVCTLVAEEMPSDVEKIQAYTTQLHIRLQQEAEPAADELPADADLETTKTSLEDLYNLL